MCSSKSTWTSCGQLYIFAAARATLRFLLQPLPWHEPGVDLGPQLPSCSLPHGSLHCGENQLSNAGPATDFNEFMVEQGQADRARGRDPNDVGHEVEPYSGHLNEGVSQLSRRTNYVLCPPASVTYPACSPVPEATALPESQKDELCS